jgi:ligand-binding sensor protein
MCEFCQEVRTNPILFEKCIACDNRGFDMCDATRKPYIYRCHMGVIEAIAPIYSGEMSIGYLMFGQIATENKEEIRLNASLVNEKYNMNLTEDLIEGITVSNDDYIAAAVGSETDISSSSCTDKTQSAVRG